MSAAHLPQGIRHINAAGTFHPLTTQLQNNHTTKPVLINLVIFLVNLNSSCRFWLAHDLRKLTKFISYILWKYYVLCTYRRRYQLWQAKTFTLLNDFVTLNGVATEVDKSCSWYIMYICVYLISVTVSYSACTIFGVI